MTKRTVKTGLLFGAAAAAIVAMDSARAQDSADPGIAVEPAIIVTARRVEESLQDVPISITVYNQEQIDKRNIVVASDLATYTPSLSVNQRFGPEKSTFAIRGFNQDISTAPTVGVYFADVVGVRAQGGTVSGNTVGAGAFSDLQNVQVLKGPQGTLFGRNTTGGAVLLVPRKPTGNLEGFVQGSIGDYDMRRVQAALNVPLAETFKVRMSVDRMTRDGYMRNLSGIGPEDYNDTDYFYGRLSIVAELTPELENYTIFHYSNSETNGRASRFVTCDRQFLADNPLPPQDSRFARWLTTSAGCNQIDRQAARGDSLFEVEVSNPDPSVQLETWQVINTTTWLANDWLTVKNIASYGEFRERAHFNLYSDNFFIPAPLPTAGQRFDYITLDVAPGQYNAAQSTFTEEIQFQGNVADGRFSWVVGGYLEFSRPLGWSAGRTAAFLQCERPRDVETCTNPLGFGSVSAPSTKFDFDNHGIFAQGTYNFTDEFALTLGGRYTFDKIKAVGESTRIRFLPGDAGVRDQVCNDSLRFNTPGPDPDMAPDPLVVSSPAECHNEIEAESNKPTWLINFDYKPAADILLYAKYSRGYRQGGININNVGVETWEPEKVDAFELGAKTSFHGVVSGYFNVAAFYNELRNQQIFGGLIAKPESGLPGAAAIINAAKSTIKGIEVDASATAFEGLRFDLGYTYLDTEVSELVAPILPPNSPYASVEPTATEGDRLTFSPKHRLTLTGTYTLPLSESIGEISLGATYVYTSEQISDASQPPEVGIIPETNLLNVNVNWDGIFGSEFDAAFFMTNVTDEVYPVGTGGGWGSAGFGDIPLAPPRMYGFRLRYEFGSR